MEPAGSNHRQRSRSTHTRTWSTCMHLSDDLLAYQRRLFGSTTTTALVAATTTSSLAVLCLIAPSARLWREGKNQFRICTALVCSPRFLATSHISSSSYLYTVSYLHPRQLLAAVLIFLLQFGVVGQLNCFLLWMQLGEGRGTCTFSGAPHTSAVTAICNCKSLSVCRHRQLSLIFTHSPFHLNSSSNGLYIAGYGGL